MVTNRLENSTDYVSIISWTLLVTMAVVLAEVWIFSDSTDPMDRMVGLAIGAILWVFGFYFFGLKVSYLMRPRSVEMSDHGVKLNMRLGKSPVIIAWPDVLMIELKTSIMGKDIGAICDDIEWYYPIDHHIAVELREAYRRRMGRYPPNTLDELCPGMQKDVMALSSSEYKRKYERFKKKD